MSLAMSSPRRAKWQILPAVGLHAREGKHAGHLSGAADEQGHGSAVLAAHMNLAFEDEHHMLGRSALFVEDVAGAGDHLGAVAGEPEAVFEGQAVERADAVEGLGYLFDWGRQGGGCNGEGKHPGTSGCSSSG